MADLEVGGLGHESSTTKGVARNVGFYARVSGMGLVYTSVNFEDPSMYHFALANCASSTGREERLTQEELAAGHLGRSVAEKAALLVGAGRTFRKRGSK
jgi:catechol 2,3-dioxygenase-like lactoylglutathione lyase family enzyme